MEVTGGFGKAVLAHGPESLLSQRAIERVVAAARKARPDAQLTRLGALGLDAGTLSEATGASLFTSASIVVVTGLDDLPAELVAPLVELAANPGEDVALGLAHPGGVKGRGVVDKLKKAGVAVVDCPAMKAWEVPGFATAEAKRIGGRMDAVAATALVEAVGSDLRTVASAVRQLYDDSADGQLTADAVRRYFGGRAEVTSFGVADDIMNGDIDGALAKLRWALATGVPPVLVTSAIASGLRGLGKYLDARNDRLRDADLSRVTGIPFWKLKNMPALARTWQPGAIAQALRATAKADAEVKGAAVDAGFALEHLVIEVGRLRRAPSGRR